MFRRLLSSIRTEQPAAETPPAAAPPGEDPAAAAAAADGVAVEAEAAISRWLKWDRLPSFSMQELRADPLRWKVAGLLFTWGSQAEAGAALDELLTRPHPHAVDVLLYAELLLRQEKQEQVRALLEQSPGFAAGMRGRAAYILAQIGFNRGEFADARRWLEIALADAPDAPSVQLLSGMLLQAESRLDEAEAQLRRLLASHPEDFAARVCLGLVLQHQGRMADGLAEMVTAEIFSGGAGTGIPAWDGRPLGADTLLISTNAGIGDILQNLRYALPLRRRQPRARLVLWTRAEVAPAARLMGIFDEVLVAQTLNDASFDWEISLLRLSLRHHIGSPSLLGETPYLFCDEVSVDAMRARLAELDKLGEGPLRVGLRWSGASTSYDARRSIPSARLTPLFRQPGIRWVALLEQGHPELPALHDGSLPLADFSGHLHDMADTAALMCALDLVISVDTSTAHLAGALGVRCWMLARPEADSRWGLTGEQSTLYASARVFRHPGRLDWDHVLNECAAALAALPRPAGEAPAAVEKA